MNKLGLVILALLTLVVAACGSGNQAQTSSGGEQSTEVSAFKLMPAGGQFIVQSTSSALNGMQINVPNGAVAVNVDMSVRQIDPQSFYIVTPKGYNIVGVIFEIFPTEMVLMAPATVSVPFTPADMKVAHIYDKTLLKLYVCDVANKVWLPATVVSIDTVNNKLVGEINKFGVYAILGLYDIRTVDPTQPSDPPPVPQ